TGQVFFEFDQNARPAACDYTGAVLTNPPGADATTQTLIDTCNPGANRSVGDFALVFDPQGQSLMIVQRTFLGVGFGPGITLTSSVSEAAAAADALTREWRVGL